MLPTHLPVVCVCTGEAFQSRYIENMLGMLQRHCPIPFTLYCLSDRPREVPAAVRVQVLDDWQELESPGMRQTTKKLRLFDRHGLPEPAFLYLDLSLVIRRDLSDLLEFAFNAPQDLVIVRDWYEPGFNSSVMRIRTGALSVVCEAFKAGERHPQSVKGDQEFIHAALKARNLLDRTTVFPDELIISYKVTRRLSRKDPRQAHARLAGATIVKFHGNPKPHEVLGGFRESLRARLRRSGNFGRDELRRHWRPYSPAA